LLRAYYLSTTKLYLFSMPFQLIPSLFTRELAFQLIIIEFLSIFHIPLLL